MDRRSKATHIKQAIIPPIHKSTTSSFWSAQIKNRKFYTSLLSRYLDTRSASIEWLTQQAADSRIDIRLTVDFAHCILHNFRTKPSIACIYLIDSISRWIGGTFVNTWRPHLSSMMMKAYRILPERASVLKVLNHWMFRGIYPGHVLKHIEDAFKRIDWNRTSPHPFYQAHARHSHRKRRFVALNDSHNHQPPRKRRKQTHDAPADSRMQIRRKLYDQFIEETRAHSRSRAQTKSILSKMAEERRRREEADNTLLLANHQDSLREGTSDAGDEEDFDVQVLSAKAYIRCPLSLCVMQHPIKSKVCGHTFEKLVIRKYIDAQNKKSKAVECPMAGCCVVITKSGFVFDLATLKLIAESETEAQRVEQARDVVDLNDDDDDDDDDEDEDSDIEVLS